MPTIECDVAVVGAGPSGLLVAMELAQAGVRTVILERRGEPALPRAGTLTPRVLEILDSRGLADSVLERAHEIHTEPKAADTIWAGFPGVRFGDLDTPFPYLLVFAQMEVEAILESRVRELGGTLLRGHDVVGIAQSADGVTLTVTDPGGGSLTVEAEYVVGSDGARSTVRTLSGIDFVGHDADRTAVNVDAVLDYPWPKPVMVTNNLNGWGLSYPLRHGRTRFGLIDAVDSHADRTEPVTLEQSRAMLTRIYGTDFGISEASTTRFHNEMRLADRLRLDRVVLVGEAVRVHYPASGVGMNFCLQDAFNLGWKLAATVRGWAPPGLLDSYEVERRPEIEKLLDDVRRQCAVQFTFTEEMLALKRMIEDDLIPIPAVNRMLAENLSGLSARYPGPIDGPDLVGRRLRDQEVIGLDGTPTTVHRCLSRATFLLLSAQSSAPRAVRPTAAPVEYAAFDAAAPGPMAGLAEVLVRPDGHVAAADSQPLSSETLAAWLGGHA